MTCTSSLFPGVCEQVQPTQGWRSGRSSMHSHMQSKLVKLHIPKEGGTMIRVNIFYPYKEGGRFDLDYYLNTHMPMAIEKLGPSLMGVTIEHGVSGVLPGTQAAYIVTCNYTFASAE